MGHVIEASMVMEGMDSMDLIFAVLVLVLALVASGIWCAMQVARSSADQGLPAHLHGAPLAFAEQTFRSARHHLVARLDRAYRTAHGLQLVELKTRAAAVVYPSDVIELSVQRIALQDQTGEAVSRDAWVVVQDSRTARRTAHKVRLLDSDYVLALSDRYRNIVRGRIRKPSPSRSIAQCDHCAHRARCAATFLDRG